MGGGKGRRRPEGKLQRQQVTGDGGRDRGEESSESGCKTQTEGETAVSDVKEEEEEGLGGFGFFKKNFLKEKRAHNSNKIRSLSHWPTFQFCILQQRASTHAFDCSCFSNTPRTGRNQSSTFKNC